MLRISGCPDLWYTFVVSLQPYVDREDDGEAAGTRRVGEVRCVVLVERYRA